MAYDLRPSGKLKHRLWWGSPEIPSRRGFPDDSELTFSPEHLESFLDFYGSYAITPTAISKSVT